MAVERPMPEDPPVIRMVFGVEERVVREEGVGVKRVIFLRVLKLGIGKGRLFQLMVSDGIGS